MTSFAAHADFGKCRVEFVLRRVVVFADVGGVAFRAHVVPVLLRPCPMQRVRRWNVLTGIEMEPALAVFVFGPRVPSIGQGLEPSIRKLDEVLLKRIDTEGVFDGEVSRLAVLSLRLHGKAAVLTEKACYRAEMLSFRIVEVAEYGCLCRVLHRVRMLRTSPGGAFRSMTARAGGRTYEALL